MVKICGICGIYGLSLGPIEINAFRNLLILNVFRGQDATGAVRVNRKKQSNVLRAVVDSTQFVQTETAKKWMSVSHDPILFMGHCRAATIGAITKKNTHPFSFPNTIGMMNGTFRGDFENSGKYATDSEGIFANINEFGVQDGLSKSMVWDPQYALSWVDKKEQSLNFIKNDKRPLCLTFINNRQALIWSSTMETLKTVVEFHNFTASGFSASDKVKYFDLNENALFSIKLGSPAVSRSLIHVDVKKKVYFQPSSGSMYDDDYGSESYGNFWKKQQEKDKKHENGSYIKRLDGQYRTDAQEVQHVEDANRARAALARRIRASKDTDNDHEDLTRLNWLEKKPPGVMTETDRFYDIAMAITGSASDDNKPKSASEMKYKLGRGCACCNKVVDWRDDVEVAAARWWSRDAFACGDCYDNVTGETEWVRYTVEGDWPADIKDVSPTPNKETGTVKVDGNIITVH